MKKRTNEILAVIDIDGTLCHIEWRAKLAGKEPKRTEKKKYLQWLRKVQNKHTLMQDQPITGMKELVNIFKTNAVYITARSETYRDVTEKWLKKHGFPKRPLYMRQKNDWSGAGTYKAGIIIDILEKKGYNVPVVVLDDDSKTDLQYVCKLHGWTFLKALSGR